jgi:type II secretory pathway component PulJ
VYDISDIDEWAAAADARSVQLAELLVALSLLGLVFAATAPVLEHVMRAFGEGAARVEAQQGVRVALERLAHDIRAAGYGRTAVDFAAVAVADSARIVLQSDLNGDGAVAGAGETITWRLDSDILRRDAGGGAQPIVNGVRSFTLVYLDATGVVTSTPSAVRSVRIDLTTAPTRTQGPPGSDIVTTLATTVRLRNR